MPQDELVEILSSLNKKYGNEAVRILKNREEAEILDDSNMTHSHLSNQLSWSVFDFARQIKKNINFVGIFFAHMKMETADHLLLEVNQRLRIVVKVLLDQ